MQFHQLGLVQDFCERQFNLKVKKFELKKKKKRKRLPQNFFDKGKQKWFLR